MNKQFLSRRSVAQFFDVSQSTVARWVESGVLPKPVHIGGVTRWDAESLMRAAVGAINDRAGVRSAESLADEALEAFRRERSRDQTPSR